MSVTIKTTAIMDWFLGNFLEQSAKSWGFVNHTLGTTSLDPSQDSLDGGHCLHRAAERRGMKALHSCSKWDMKPRSECSSGPRPSHWNCATISFEGFWRLWIFHLFLAVNTLETYEWFHFVMSTTDERCGALLDLKIRSQMLSCAQRGLITS
jgi:hypothetical protein